MAGASPQPVLIGFDGYDDAAAAISGAGALLPPRRAIVAYVWKSLASLLLDQQVDTLTGTMHKAAGFDAQAIAAEGKPKAWPTLLRLAEEHDAAAIVIGSKGLGAVRSALLGSVS